MQSADVAHAFLEAVAARDRDRVLQLWQPTGTWEFPYGDIPLLAGADAIGAFLDRLFAAFAVVGFEAIAVYPTVDPAVVFATYSGNMQTRADGKPYQNEYVAMFLCEDGKIHSLREYFNPDVVRRLSA